MDAKAADALEMCLRLVPAMRRTVAELEKQLIEGGGSKDIVLDERRPEGIPSNPTANKAVQVASDPDLRLLRRRLSQIENAYAGLDMQLRFICDLMFWSPMRDLGLEYIGDQVGYSRRTLERKRMTLLVHFSQHIEFGWEKPTFWWGLSPLPED